MVIRRGGIKVMMYSEFIEMSGNSESYISLTEYTEEIEPIYMNCDIPNKQEFIELFKDVFKKIVYPIANRGQVNIHSFRMFEH